MNAARPLTASDDVLVGRDDLLADIGRVCRSGARLVTLVGPAGAGKSELARRLATDWPGAKVRLVVSPTPPDLDRLAADPIALADSFVVLDDVDDALEACADLVTRCVSAAPGVCFMVTARAALRVEGEMVVGVGPLAPDAARTLFLESARGAVSPNDPAIDVLLAELDCLPLAIELAAQRSQVLSPADMLARMSDRFRFLKSNRRDAPERHATLAGAIAISWTRLSVDERLALAALAMFEGPVAIELFEDVVGSFVKSDPLDLAQALVDGSLATTVRTGAIARLSMLRTLRAFARERSRSLPEHDALRAAHARLYADRARALSSRTYGEHAHHAFAALEEDLPNFHAAFDVLLSSDRPRAVALAIDLGDLLVFRNAIDPKSSLFSRALEAAEDAGDDRLRARARVLAAKAALELGDAARAERLLVEARALAHANDLPDDEADAARSLAWARLALANAADAEKDADAALARHRETHHARGQADALACRGLARRWLGDESNAAADLDEAYAIHRRAGDTTRAERVLAMARVAGLSLQAKERASDATAIEAEADSHRAQGRRWREALDRLRLAGVDASPEDRLRQLALAREAALVAGVDRRITTSLLPEPNDLHKTSGKIGIWQIGIDARWIESPEGTRTSLVRHGSARRVLEALAARRLDAPGTALSPEALLEAGWPGERVRWESGLLRVYTAIRRLRALGLQAVLVTRDDGYLFAPDVDLARGRD